MFRIRIRIDFDPQDPYPGGQKWQQNRKIFRNFMCCSAGCSPLRAEGFFCSFDVLYVGLERSKLQFFVLKKNNIFSCKFFQF
jgi:hypothetical protein